MEKPIISVVIPAYNEEEYLKDTLDALQNQDFKNFEIIVVDNNSTDKTAQIAKKSGAKVISEPQKGVAFARQAGFVNAQGEIIVTTDADSLPPPNWLSKIYQTFSQDPNIVAVTGFFEFYDSGFFFKTVFSFLSKLFFIITQLYSGTNIAVKKTAFQKIGGFDIRYSVGEDIDICRRLKRVGKVVRLWNLTVKTSSRRYRKNGVLLALLNYTIIFFKIKLSLKNQPKSLFKGGSEIKLSFFGKILDYSLILFILFSLFLSLKKYLSFHQPPTTVSLKTLYAQKIYPHLPKITPSFKKPTIPKPKY